MDKSSEQMQIILPGQNGNGLAGESFGCCSRYRDCSDTGTCLIPKLDYSANCSYRRSLESGHVFYGKKSELFERDKYQHFVSRYTGLSDSETGILREILYYFFIKKRLASLGMFKICEEDVMSFKHIEKAGFLRLIFDPKMVIGNCTKKAMLTACGKDIKDANQWAKNQVSPENWKKRKSISKNDYPDNADEKDYKGIKIYKEELARWIVSFSQEILNRLSKDIYFIEIDLDGRYELEEFFMDTLYQENCIFTLDTGENDPRFLVQK